MGICYFCGKKVEIPHRCVFCNLTFCDEHRLPEQHNCIKEPGRDWSTFRELKTVREAYPRSSARAKLSRRKHYILAFSLICIISVAFIYYTDNPYSEPLNSFVEEVKSYFEQEQEIEEAPDENVNKFIRFPVTEEELIDHALNEINKERNKHGLPNVTLSPIQSAQTHADNLLKNRVLSHWGTDGTKPYMRYTLAGGEGAVSENCAWQSSTGLLDPFKAIEELNNGMMYEDADSGWGHKDNILDPLHNRVSIGIARDSSNLFLVQDFEDYYYYPETFEIVQEHTVITITCNSTLENWKPNIITVYYDPLPSALSPEILSKPPYDAGYGMGDYVSSVVPQGYEVKEGITINANYWSVHNSYFKAKFDLTKASDTRGNGVYTLAIWESEEIYTTYSIWLTD